MKNYQHNKNIITNIEASNRSTDLCYINRLISPFCAFLLHTLNENLAATKSITHVEINFLVINFTVVII